MTGRPELIGKTYTIFAPSDSIPDKGRELETISPLRRLPQSAMRSLRPESSSHMLKTSP